MTARDVISSARHDLWNRLAHVIPPTRPEGHSPDDPPSDAILHAVRALIDQWCGERERELVEAIGRAYRTVTWEPGVSAIDMVVLDVLKGEAPMTPSQAEFLRREIALRTAGEHGLCPNCKERGAGTRAAWCEPCGRAWRMGKEFGPDTEPPRRGPMSAPRAEEVRQAIEEEIAAIGAAFVGKALAPKCALCGEPMGGVVKGLTNDGTTRVWVHDRCPPKGPLVEVGTLMAPVVADPPGTHPAGWAMRSADQLEARTDRCVTPASLAETNILTEAEAHAAAADTPAHLRHPEDAP